MGRKPGSKNKPKVEETVNEVMIVDAEVKENNPPEYNAISFGISKFNDKYFVYQVQVNTLTGETGNYKVIESNPLEEVIIERFKILVAQSF